MTRKYILYFTMIILFATGCGLREREAALQQKEAAFAAREMQLQYKEKSLQLKEEALMVLQQQMDSSHQDTKRAYDSTITGVWNVKMTCIETSCAGSAIGDSKSETWKFTYQDNNILVKAMAGEKLVRIYSGTIDGDNILLAEDITHSASAPGTKILVSLNLAANGSMQGQRHIIRDNVCKILYRLQLNKQ